MIRRLLIRYYEWRLRQLADDCRRAGIHPSRSATYYYTAKHWQSKLDVIKH